MSDNLACLSDQDGRLPALALSHMMQALEFLDRDPALPGIIGARLQHAIDTLCDECGLETPTPLIF
ncbi:hypothetical protein [Sphingomonas xanthus]|uniref:Uncharacterized protein n=1 Tax=Sphingomonas xanthus TaxID=2594473 RepID=A0A516IU45_9SPHN|nr:hypothetical protein [Sphingomonas xanthus]QDP20423.1 hypothetical protein FMM02_10940 [Sphingomonas xanthus]